MNRIESVDIFRLIAITAVINAHTTLFQADILTGNVTYKYLELIFDQLARFVIPFFCVISGYFWGAKIRRGSELISTSIKMAKRILILFLAWCIIYLLPYNFSSIIEYGVLGPFKLSYGVLHDLLKDPITLLFQGTKIHLWYLPGLFCAIIICTFFIAVKKIRLLIILSISFYLFGVLAKSYADTPLGIHIGFNTRNGPFFCTLPFVVGYLLSGKISNKKWMFYGFFIYGSGLILHFTEIFMLWKIYSTKALNQDYVIGTFFMGFGIAIASLSDHPVLKNKILAKIGRMTLGIYLVHYIFVDLLRPIDKLSDNVAWEIGYVLIVLILSVFTAFLLSRNKITKILVL